MLNDCIIDEGTRSRFWAKVDKSEDCWEWTACKDRDGYGWLGCVFGRMVGAHRVSWMITHGEIPESMLVLHMCDNPGCVNPAHLWLGTHQDNMADRDAKGRQAKGDCNGARLHPERLARGARSGARKHPKSYRGERSGNAKLTEVNVVEIRANVDGLTQLALGARYGMSQPQISAIQLRRSWKHVE